MSKTTSGPVIASPSIPQDKLREAIPKTQLFPTVEIARELLMVWFQTLPAQVSPP
jgi:hypothetical protein